MEYDEHLLTWVTADIFLQIERALDKLQDVFDNPYILKSLTYMLIDMIFMELFPEYDGKLCGMVPLKDA